MPEIFATQSTAELYASPGPMKKCAADIFALSELLLGRPLQTSGMGSWDGVRVAFVDADECKMAKCIGRQFPGPEEQMVIIAAGLSFHRAA